MPADKPPIRVYKLGGSLLDWEGLPAALAALQRQHPESSPVMVVGGGATADLVRRWDELYRLGEERAHWLALESLALNEQLLQLLWPELRPVRSGPQAHAAAADRVPALVCASCFVRWGEKSGAPPLPHTWHVTTDSIAAWVAGLIGATQLVLLKSTDLPPHTTFAEGARQGLVDLHFPVAVQDVPEVRWINLRSAAMQDIRWDG